MEKLSDAVKLLFSTKRFYAHCYLSCRVVYDHKDIPTAAARMSKDGPVLYFNTEFIAGLTTIETAALIEHELDHILFGHVNFRGKSNHRPRNIAMDCAINQLIQGLPSKGVTLEWFEKSVKKKLNPLDNWEYYYAQIPASADLGDGSNIIDDHDTDTGIEEASEQESKMHTKAMASSALKSSSGEVPEKLQSILGELMGDARLPWQQIIASFVSRARSDIRIATRKRINRRWGFESPGYKKKRELVLGVCLDSSGSVSDESYSKFIAEINKARVYCKEVHYIEADCVVQSTRKLTKNSTVKLERTGNGGTAYQPAISKCLELGCDAIIYFGDGDCADTPTNPGVPFLWVMAQGGSKPADFGQEVSI